MAYSAFTRQIGLSPPRLMRQPSQGADPCGSQFVNEPGTVSIEFRSCSAYSAATGIRAISISRRARRYSTGITLTNLVR